MVFLKFISSINLVGKLVFLYLLLNVGFLIAGLFNRCFLSMGFLMFIVGGLPCVASMFFIRVNDKDSDVNPYQ